MSDQCCETCRFWSEVKIARHNGGVPVGVCHRYPPVLRKNETGSEHPVDDFEQPWTTDEDWCGEWQAKERGMRRRTFLAGIAALVLFAFGWFFAIMEPMPGGGFRGLVLLALAVIVLLVGGGRENRT